MVAVFPKSVTRGRFRPIFSLWRPLLGVCGLCQSGAVAGEGVSILVPRALGSLRGSSAVDRLVGAMVFSLWRPFPKPIYLYGHAADKVMAAFALAELGGRPWSGLRADGIPFDMRKGEWFVIEHPMVLEDLVPAHRPTLLRKELRKILDGLELSAAMGRSGELVAGVPPATIVTGDPLMLPEFRDRVFSCELLPDLERSQYREIVTGETASARVELGGEIRDWLRGPGSPSMDDYLDMWGGLQRTREEDRACVAACRFGLRLLDQFLDAHDLPFDSWPWTREPPSTSEASVSPAGVRSERSGTRRRPHVTATTAERRVKPTLPSSKARTADVYPRLVTALVDAVRHAIDEERAHVYDLHGSFSEEISKRGRQVGILINGRLLLLCAPARALLALDLAGNERPSLPDLSAALELVGLVQKDEAGKLARSYVHEGKTVKVWDIAADEFWSRGSGDPRAQS